MANQPLVFLAQKLVRVRSFSSIQSLSSSRLDVQTWRKYIELFSPVETFSAVHPLVKYGLVDMFSSSSTRRRMCAWLFSAPLNKVGHAYFRLFRWFSDYNPKKESTVTTIWVRLPNLPLYLYESSFTEAIVLFGYFVSVDDDIIACTSLKFARACVELDVTKPIPKAIWINPPDNRSYYQDIEIESKLGYCTRCKVHGHSFVSCRKRKDSKTKDTNSRKNDAHEPALHDPVHATSNLIFGDNKQVSHGPDLHDPIHAPRNVVMGNNKQVKVTIVGSSSKSGGDDLQWQKVTHKKSKHQAFGGTFVSKEQPKEATSHEKGTNDILICDDSSKEQTALILDNQNHLAVVPYIEPLTQPLYEEQKDKSCEVQTVAESMAAEGSEAPSNSNKEMENCSNKTSAEVHLDEKLQSYVHPTGYDHYSNIQDKAGTARGQPGEKNMGYITTRA